MPSVPHPKIHTACRRILVVGGAGYVGSATCAWLIDQGHEVWVLDDLSTGHLELALGEHLIYGRAGDADVQTLLKREKFDCVMHFAARSLVAESVQKPKEYYENNVVQTRELLDSMLKAGTRRFIFSSTCAIFGDPGTDRIHENLPKSPLNPYGETKLQVEKILAEYSRTKGLQAVALRYFNAAGAEPGLRVGEWHDPETHLIPSVLRGCAEGRPIKVFGTDYPTPDGTCIRDYIHVTDLAQAHATALERLCSNPSENGSFEAFNIGSENGYSVREVIAACQKVLATDALRIEKSPRRPGDPPRLVADSALAQKTLGFKINFGLEAIVRSAWNWEIKRQELLRNRKKAIFLDRDGTLNEDPGYISDPAKLKLFPGVGEALSELKRAGFALVVISNQSGVARGLIPEGALPKVHARLDELLKHFGVTLDHYELCVHHPDDNCECRKPKPKLILDATRKLGIDLSRSYMVGDKQSDLETGRAARCKGVALVRTGNGLDTENRIKSAQSQDADFAGNSLREVARWILAQET